MSFKEKRETSKFLIWNKAHLKLLFLVTADKISDTEKLKINVSIKYSLVENRLVTTQCTLTVDFQNDSAIATIAIGSVNHLEGFRLWYWFT